MGHDHIVAMRWTRAGVRTAACAAFFLGLAVSGRASAGGTSLEFAARAAARGGYQGGLGAVPAGQTGLDLVPEWMLAAQQPGSLTAARQLGGLVPDFLAMAEIVVGGKIDAA